MSKNHNTLPANFDELTPENFNTSSRCDTSSCVAVGITAMGAVLRDKVEGTLGDDQLTFPAADWGAFMGGVKSGAFDRPRAEQ